METGLKILDLIADENELIAEIETLFFLMQPLVPAPPMAVPPDGDEENGECYIPWW